MTGRLADPIEELCKADVLVVPSRYESGLPLVVLEGLAAGLPVLLSDIPAHRDRAARVGGTRLAQCDDAVGWAQVLVAIRASLEMLSGEALASADLFSVDGMVDATVALYHEVLEGMGRKPRPSR